MQGSKVVIVGCMWVKLSRTTTRYHKSPPGNNTAVTQPYYRKTYGVLFTDSKILPWLGRAL
jgi:hypothetical protein